MHRSHNVGNGLKLWTSIALQVPPFALNMTGMNAGIWKQQVVVLNTAV